MSIIEILAVVFIAAFFLRVSMLLWGQRYYYKLTKTVMENQKLFTVISVILLLVAGYYLFQEMSTIQVAAAAVFIYLFEAVSFFTYSHYDELIELKKKVLLNRTIVKKNWFTFILWTIFAFWVILKLISG
jgi:hypothetical protein